MVYTNPTYGPLNITADFTLYDQGNNKTRIINVNNVLSQNLQDNSSAQVLYTDDDQVNENLNNPFNFTAPRDDFDLWVEFDTLSLTFWEGYIDDGSFTIIDGRMFTKANSCYNTEYEKDSPLIQCCNKFVPAPDVTQKYPRCNKFRSRVSVLNVNDNYSVFATFAMNLTLSKDNELAGIGIFQGPETSVITYGLNNKYYLFKKPNTTLDASYTLLNGDTKFFLTAYIYPPEVELITVGRFILRENQTLLDEGIPFTHQNNCIYFNEPIEESNQVTHSEFCCQKFENN
uniref:Uncharacterized protein n=1 Tax=Panagrolaimus davidi TaxID=227884 RepID=A0A914QHP9_9BILA